MGDGSVANANGAANTEVTAFGGLDALTKADQARKGAAAPSGLPGSGPLGYIGGALAALGLANDVYDMSKRGVNGENGLNATSNALGVASMIPGPVGMVAASGAAGMAFGSQSNKMVADSGLLGENVDGSSRNWSDMAADWGTAADEAVGGGALGTVAGVGATLAGSAVGTGATVAGSGLVAADMAVDLGSAGVDLAGDAWDYVWD